MGGQGWSYLSSQCALTRPCVGQLPGAGDDKLIQTYSYAVNPNGCNLTRASVCCVIKQPLSVTSVEVFQPFPETKSEEYACHQTPQSLLLHSQSQWSWTLMLAYCLSRKRGCVIEPKQTPGTFTFETNSCLICTPVLFFECILTSKLSSPSTVSRVILKTTRVGLLVFHSGLGITCLYEEIIIRIVTKRAPCQQNWT